jgi:hypothetical protein
MFSQGRAEHCAHVATKSDSQVSKRKRIALRMRRHVGPVVVMTGTHSIRPELKPIARTPFNGQNIENLYASGIPFLTISPADRTLESSPV